MSRHIVVLPKMTKDYYRCLLMQPTGKSFDDTHFLNFYRYCIIMLEFIKAHDYCNDFIIVWDYRAINLLDLVNHIKISELRQAAIMCLEGYGMRINSIHLITPSKMVDHLVKIFKSVLSEKIGGRIQVHKDLEAIYEFVPKEMIPEDLGGSEESIESLQEKWLNVLGSEDHISYLKEMQEAYTDERLRQTDIFNEQYLGMPGSFRS